MTKLQAVFISGVLGASFLTVCGQTSPAITALNEADLRRVLADITKQVNSFYKVEGFPVLVPSADLATFKYDTNSEYHETTGDFIPTEQALISTDILASSGKLIYFCNSAAEHAYENSSKYDVKPSAKWTQAHAIEVATKFAAIFLKPWGKNLSAPSTLYGWTGTSFDERTGKPQWIAGMWTVHWMQQTPSGILYRTGGAAVQLSEEYGPLAAYIDLPTQYDDDPVTPMPKEKALIEARKGLDKITVWGPAKGALSGLKIQGEPNAELMIVQPNHLTDQASIADAGHSNGLKARLAWVITYKVIIASGQGDGKISVYIDAKDGSFLGGYF